MQSEDEFLRELCRKLEEAGSMSERLVNHLGQRLRQFVAGGWEGNPVHAIGKIDAKDFAEALISSLNAQDRDTLILVDEIALFVSARLTIDSQGTAAFLYRLRRLRQSYPRVRWLLTGSIGLDVVARRVNLLGAFVDMEVLSLEPFDGDQARSYLDHLCATNALRRPFSIDEQTFTYFSDELGWLAPYYIKLLADRISPTGENNANGRPFASRADVERAFEEILKPAYRALFYTWEEHVDKNFPEQDSKRLHAILNICCEAADGETADTLLARLNLTPPSFAPRELKDLLTALANSGILHEMNGRWRFQSGLLRRYWLKYIHV